MKRITKAVTLIAFIAASWIFLPPQTRGQGNYEEAVNKADALVRSGRFVEALSAAQDAIKINPGNYKAYYYAAFALYKQDLLNEAEPYARQSLALAAISDEPDVRRLVDAINGRRSFTQYLKEADHAFEQGLILKAAKAYTRAWEADPRREEIGVKAANLWIDRLNDPAEGVRILKEIAAKSTGSDIAQQALQKAQKLGEALVSQARQKSMEADTYFKSNNYDEAIKSLEIAIKAAPQVQPYHLQLMKVYARQKNVEAALQEFGMALKIGPVNLASYFYNSDYNYYYTEFNDLMYEPKFVDFIKEAYGEKMAEEVKRITTIEGTAKTLKYIFDYIYSRDYSDEKTKGVYNEWESPIRYRHWMKNFDGCSFELHQDYRGDGGVKRVSYVKLSQINELRYDDDRGKLFILYRKPNGEIDSQNTIIFHAAGWNLPDQYKDKSFVQAWRFSIEACRRAGR